MSLARACGTCGHVLCRKRLQHVRHSGSLHSAHSCSCVAGHAAHTRSSGQHRIRCPSNRSGGSDSCQSCSGSRSLTAACSPYLRMYSVKLQFAAKLSADTVVNSSRTDTYPTLPLGPPGCTPAQQAHTKATQCSSRLSCRRRRSVRRSTLQPTAGTDASSRQTRARMYRLLACHHSCPAWPAHRLSQWHAAK